MPLDGPVAPPGPPDRQPALDAIDPSSKEQAASHISMRGIDRLSSIGAIATTAIILVGAALGYGAVSMQPHLLADEGFHAPQIRAFFFGQFEIHPAITMVPGYHAVLALLERAIGYHSYALLRRLTLLVSLLLPVIIWKLVAIHSPQRAGLRTVQWYFMPLLFPFFFLVYTDVWAITAVLATLYWALRGRHLPAGLAGLIAVLMRQDMIIWVGMAWLLVVLGESRLDSWRSDWRNHLRAGLLRGLPLLLILLAFAAFYAWNGGVAVGDRARHRVGFNPTNVAYFLLCGWVVFLPQNIKAVPDILRLLRRPVCIAVLIAGFALYMGTYANKHQFNSAGMRFYLHNEGLYWLTKYTWLRAIAFVPMAWMVLTVCVTRLAEPRLHVLYLVAPLSVGLHPLIEQRYYLPALTLFQAWRPDTGARWESALLAAYAMVTPVIMWGIVTERFFL